MTELPPMTDGCVGICGLTNGERQDTCGWGNCPQWVYKHVLKWDETPCPAREDKTHCVHWYEEEPCCSCGEK